MKKRILCVFAYITCVLFVAACGHNEFTASEQSRSLNSVPLSALPASQYNPITGKFVDEINGPRNMEFGGYPNHMEYHQKVAIDEYNNARRAE
ncbi:hypothetical protein [Candidatus Lariskella endosymbiont of Epinotia ramella]|uniref:hypothetical protein n=1 Tax=Candidatus Lariskella endosymbiont of Epinotia ramella TaxID=3066224 RepID=UPI0030D5CF02